MKIGHIECKPGERAFGYLEVDRTASEIPVNDTFGGGSRQQQIELQTPV